MRVLFYKPVVPKAAPADPHEHILLSSSTYSHDSKVPLWNRLNRSLLKIPWLAIYSLRVEGWKTTVCFSFDRPFHASNSFREEHGLTSHYGRSVTWLPRWAFNDGR